MSFYNINPIVYLVFTTFIIGFLFLNKTTLNNKVLFFILVNYFLTEVASIILIKNKISVGFLYNISIYLQFVFWLTILTNVLKKNLFSVLLFTMITIVTMLFKFLEFNNYIFFIGTIIYLLNYIFGNFELLKKERLVFFQTKDFFLISIPLLFFVGMSFILSYDSAKLTAIKVFPNFNLYRLINYFVNTVFYFSIIIYIYKERKQKNA